MFRIQLGKSLFEIKLRCEAHAKLLLCFLIPDEHGQCSTSRWSSLVSSGVRLYKR